MVPAPTIALRVAEQKDLLRPLVQELLQEVLEGEMTEALQARKGERTVGRLGYRGQGEWAAAKHGTDGKRRWSKLHVAVDQRGGIVA